MTSSNVAPTDIKVVRYDLYPEEEPTCYCVGFSVTCNNQTMYRDTQVPLEDASGKTETEVAQLAYASLRDSIDTWAASASEKSGLLGQTFVPL